MRMAECLLEQMEVLEENLTKLTVGAATERPATIDMTGGRCYAGVCWSSTGFESE